MPAEAPTGKTDVVNGERVVRRRCSSCSAMIVYGMVRASGSSRQWRCTTSCNVQHARPLSPFCVEHQPLRRAKLYPTRRGDVVGCWLMAPAAAVGIMRWASCLAGAHCCRAGCSSRERARRPMPHRVGNRSETTRAPIGFIRSSTSRSSRLSGAPGGWLLAHCHILLGLAINSIHSIGPGASTCLLADVASILHQ
jgi:hypothetical protein